MDGYNAIHADPSLARTLRYDRARACEGLLARLASARGLDRFPEVTVVFDGHGGDQTLPSRERHGRFVVRYSRRGQTADDLILDLVRAADPATVLVKTNDQELQAAVRALGAQTESLAEPRRSPPRPPEFGGNPGPSGSSGKRGNPRRAKKTRSEPPPLRW